MTTQELIDKYTAKSKQADKQLLALHADLKDARKDKDLEDSGLEELAAYEGAKEAHLSQKRVCQIYGQICHDLGGA
ncbi:MAG: hypothetical protein V7677_10455 [Motiliproteus sp.]